MRVSRALLLAGLCLAAPAAAADAPPPGPPSPAVASCPAGPEAAFPVQGPSPAAAAATTAPGAAAPAQSPACCVREYVRCLRNCRCGVFEFNCRIDAPTCSSSCICNICP